MCLQSPHQMRTLLKPKSLYQMRMLLKPKSLYRMRPPSPPKQPTSWTRPSLQTHPLTIQLQRKLHSWKSKMMIPTLLQMKPLQPLQALTPPLRPKQNLQLSLTTQIASTSSPLTTLIQLLFRTSTLRSSPLFQADLVPLSASKPRTARTHSAKWHLACLRLFWLWVYWPLLGSFSPTKTTQPSAALSSSALQPIRSRLRALALILAVTAVVLNFLTSMRNSTKSKSRFKLTKRTASSTFLTAPMIRESTF